MTKPNDHQAGAARALVLLLEAQALREAGRPGYVEKAIALETRARWALAEVVAIPGCGSAARVIEALS